MITIFPITSIPLVRLPNAGLWVLGSGCWVLLANFEGLARVNLKSCSSMFHFYPLSTLHSPLGASPLIPNERPWAPLSSLFPLPSFLWREAPSSVLSVASVVNLLSTSQHLSISASFFLCAFFSHPCPIMVILETPSDFSILERSRHEQG